MLTFSFCSLLNLIGSDQLHLHLVTLKHNKDLVSWLRLFLEDMKPGKLILTILFNEKNLPDREDLVTWINRDPEIMLALTVLQHHMGDATKWSVMFRCILNLYEYLFPK